MLDRRTDAEVVAASLAEPSAFMVVFDRHFAAIARYLARRLNWSVAEDIVAEVFTTAFASRARYDPQRRDALPWLYGIAANMLRSRALLARSADRAEGPSEWGGDLRFDLQPNVAEALLRLSIDEREVLLLVAWADLTYEQIAEALEIPIGTVKSRLNRARSAVRAVLTGEIRNSLEEVSHG
jgi:RNA polymerase sigma-70 factor (ECF subfamily)